MTKSLWSLAIINAWNRYTNPKDIKSNAKKAYELYQRYFHIIEQYASENRICKLRGQNETICG